MAQYSKVDEYGFQRSENFDFQLYDAFISTYMKTLTRRAQRWDKVFKDGKFTKKSRTLKRFVRKGVPVDLRPNCWMAISGAEKLRANSSFSYNDLRQLIDNSQIIEIIKIDLPRTFPDNIYFINDGDLPRMLYNVLATFANQNIQVGYCQGLNYIGGLLLLATKDEETSYWLLKNLVEEMLPKYYTKKMSGLITDMDVLNNLVKKFEPQVWRHIQNMGMPWAMGVTKWFVCLYADVLPTETVFRIWDCLFLDGSKILFKVALTLIAIHKEAILKTSDLSELNLTFKNMKQHPKVVDCHEFINEVFNYPAKITNAKIEKLRMVYKKED